MPATLPQLKQRLAEFPDDMTQQLKGIFLLSGNRRQEDIFLSSLFSYGSYWNECIFLHPYPRARMEMNYAKTPPPHFLHDFERVGAVIRNGPQGGVSLHLSIEALRHFYLYDVFTHELGHHVERDRERSAKRSEGFAEWFASEYGFRNREPQVRSA
jgi:peptidoglycan/xylan/chitin deacetylase (PgdA/CDA1 family)